MPSDKKEISIQESEQAHRAIVAMFDTGSVGSALMATGFDVEELVETFVRHMRSPDAQTSQRGIAQFLAHLKDVARMNGLVASASMTRTTSNDEGETVHEHVRTERLLRGLEQPEDATGYAGRDFVEPRDFIAAEQSEPEEDPSGSGGDDLP